MFHLIYLIYNYMLLICYCLNVAGVPYAGVIPLWKVVDPFGDAILAYEMNGVPLPRDHGFPIRLLAPGHAGHMNHHHKHV